MVLGTGNGQCKTTCCLLLVKVNKEDMVLGSGNGQCKTTWCLLLIKVNVGRHGVWYW